VAKIFYFIHAQLLSKLRREIINPKFAWFLTEKSTPAGEIEVEVKSKGEKVYRTLRNTALFSKPERYHAAFKVQR
jgi:hypothetical protein